MAGPPGPRNRAPRDTAKRRERQRKTAAFRPPPAPPGRQGQEPEPGHEEQGQGTRQGGRLMSCGGGRCAEPPNRNRTQDQSQDTTTRAKALAREGVSCLAGGAAARNPQQEPDPGSEPGHDDQGQGTRQGGRLISCGGGRCAEPPTGTGPRIRARTRRPGPRHSPGRASLSCGGAAARNRAAPPPPPPGRGRGRLHSRRVRARTRPGRPGGQATTAGSRGLAGDPPGLPVRLAAPGRPLPDRAPDDRPGQRERGAAGPPLPDPLPGHDHRWERSPSRGPRPGRRGRKRSGRSRR